MSAPRWERGGRPWARAACATPWLRVSAYGSMQPMSCTKEVVLPVEPDEAWAAVTEEEALEAWLAQRVQPAPRPCGPPTLTLPGAWEGRRRVEGGPGGGPRTSSCGPAGGEGSPGALAVPAGA